MRRIATAAAAAGAAAALAAGAGAATTLTGTVGPGFTIDVKAAKGKVRSLKPGTYTFVVNDKSSAHNFHLKGPGVDRKTSVAERGTKRWKVTLKRGTYTFVCDPHASGMKGSFTVR